MANARYRLWGPSGSGKTVTALTGRGRQAIIDRDNQMFIYLGNPRFAELFSPFATMVEDFSGLGPDGQVLAKGKPAVWSVTDPSSTTKARVAEFVAKSGIGKGDQLVEDPFSRLWELSLDAADVVFGQKGARVDYYALKRPTKSLMHAYRYAKHDICWTAHQKAEWDKAKNAPSDKVKPVGEGSTETDIMFEFRMEMTDDGTPRMTVSKQKGGLFRVGESFDSPIIRDIFGARGLYQMVDSLTEVQSPEMEETQAESLMRAESSDRVDEFIARMAAAPSLAEFRADPKNKAEAGKFSPSELAKVRAAAEALAK